MPTKYAMRWSVEEGRPLLDLGTRVIVCSIIEVYAYCVVLLAAGISTCRSNDFEVYDLLCVYQ
jgi:hypothetical protein